jgi:hypothetical protein
MVIEAVVTWQQALQLARLRNDCRLFMTRHQGILTSRDQAAWWRQAGSATDIRAFLGMEHGSPRAFGLWRRDAQGRPVVTGGVVSEARGRGLGYLMFRYLRDLEPRPVWLEVLTTNEPARKLYAKLGWVEIEASDGPHGQFITMRCDG